jgi:hypothetical protein
MARWPDGDGAHLAERALADAAEEDEVEEVDVAIEVDGLHGHTGSAGGGAAAGRSGLPWGGSRRRP